MAVMHPDVMFRIGSDPWWEKILLPIGTTFLGAGLGAFLAFWTSMKLRNRDERKKNHEAAQWSLFCLVHQWQFLKRIQKFIDDREKEIQADTEEKVGDLIYITKGISKNDTYLFIRKMKLDGYKLLDLKLDSMSHFALAGDPELMVEMTKCQELVQDLLNRMVERDDLKTKIDEIMNKSKIADYLFDPNIESAELIRQAINDRKLDEELRACTDRVRLLLTNDIAVHVEILDRMHRELHRLYPGINFVSMHDPNVRLTKTVEQ